MDECERRAEARAKATTEALYVFRWRILCCLSSASFVGCGFCLYVIYKLDAWFMGKMCNARADALTTMFMCGALACGIIYTASGPLMDALESKWKKHKEEYDG